jgi:hypothetical protein
VFYSVKGETIEITEVGTEARQKRHRRHKRGVMSLMPQMSHPNVTPLQVGGAKQG